MEKEKRAELLQRPRDLTLISRMELSASTIKAVSPLPLREDVPPNEVRVPAVKAEAARDP